MLHVDLSVLLPLRDSEGIVAPVVREAVEIAASSLPAPAPEDGPHFEILALDERSGDNTSSVLSVLHGQIPELRTLQDLDRGTGLRVASRVARGEIWLILDQPTQLDLAVWAVSQVVRGQPAAVVPGEILAVHRNLGNQVLGGLSGGLATATRLTLSELKKRGQRAAMTPASDSSQLAKTVTFLRGHAHLLGLAHLDRPSALTRSEVAARLRARASTLRNRLLL